MSRARSIAESDPLTILGSASKNLLSALKFLIQGKIDWEQLRYQLVFLGFDCMPMILALTAVASMILSLNTSIELANYGGRDVIGSLVSMSNLREILPIFIAFAVGSRSGTAITAEIATMKVTEQIDALKLLKTDPIYYLLTPKLLAGVILAPFIVALAEFVSIYAGMIVSAFSASLEFSEFLESAWHVLSLKEYFYPLVKCEIFIAYAILVNVTMGLGCKGGAREVGLATTKATALVMIGIILIDGLLTAILYT